MLTMRGQAGELRHGYRAAARLGPWTLAEAGRLEAVVVEADDLWLDAEPLDLRLVVGRQDWTWRGVRVESRAAGAVTVQVIGSPECRVVR